MILLLTPQTCFVSIPRNITRVIFLEHPFLFGFRPKASGGIMKFHPFKWQLLRGAGQNFFQTIRKPKEFIELDNFLPNHSHVYQWELENLKEDFTVYDPEDHALLTEWKQVASNNKVTLTVLDSPLFITPTSELNDYQKSIQSKRISQTSFYIWNRKRLNVLLDSNGKPEGGKWTYDKENRKPLPANLSPPPLPNPRQNSQTRELLAWTEKHQVYLSPLPGQQRFWLPLTRVGAKKWFRKFLEERFMYFGDYQDAMRSPLQSNVLMYHSGISALINIGLLTVEEVIQGSLDTYHRKQTQLADCEGFIRQIIGWREFIRWVYRWKGDEMREMNHFEHKGKLTNAWYTGETGIIPLDQSIQTAFETGYLHHIVRLMIVSNLMNLGEIAPAEAYKWFMEFSVDSWDWVMVPNVYGMGLYADGGLITTKPYVSTPNYQMIKMAGFPHGEWEQTWTALYWHFISKHQNLGGRFGPIQWNFWQKKSTPEKQAIQTLAKQWISKVST